MGLRSGSLYPILIRLADRGLLETRWETDAPHGRPPRHLYRLTPSGLALAMELEQAAGVLVDQLCAEFHRPGYGIRLVHNCSKAA